MKAAARIEERLERIEQLLTDEIRDQPTIVGHVQKMEIPLRWDALPGDHMDLEVMGHVDGLSVRIIRNSTLIVWQRRLRYRR